MVSNKLGSLVFAQKQLDAMKMLGCCTVAARSNVSSGGAGLPQRANFGLLSKMFRIPWLGDLRVVILQTATTQDWSAPGTQMACS